MSFSFVPLTNNIQKLEDALRDGGDRIDRGDTGDMGDMGDRGDRGD